MAYGKKSFLLYADQIHTVELLDDERAGKLLKMIYQYVNDQHPKSDDLIVNLAFTPIRQQLKRDLKDWEGEKTNRSNSATMGNIARWHPNLYKQIVDKEITIEEALEKIQWLKSDNPTASDRIRPDSPRKSDIASIAVNVNVNDTVTDNDTVTVKESIAKAIPSDDVVLEKKKETGKSEVEIVVGKKGKKKVPPKKKGKNPDSEPYWKEIRYKWVWFNKTHLRFNVEPIPSIDYSYMHRIIEKIRERAIAQAVDWTEENALKRWESFLTVAYTQAGEWLNKNFLLVNLASQMQTIFKIIENPNANGQHKTNRGDNTVSANSNRKMEALGKWGLSVPKDGNKGN